MKIIFTLILSILVGIVVFYVTKLFYNTNNVTNTNDENNKVDKETVEIGDVFVYEPLRITTDPFANVRTTELDSRTYIIDDLKTNSEGVIWVKYHSLSSHRRKTGFYSTSSIDSFLWRSYKHNELKHLFENYEEL